MQFDLNDVIQYGGWAVALITSGLLGQQQIAFKKFKLYIQEKLNNTELSLKNLEIKTTNSIETMEDVFETRFDAIEEYNFKINNALEKSIAVNTTKINSCSSWVKQLENNLVLISVGKNIVDEIEK